MSPPSQAGLGNLIFIEMHPPLLVPPVNLTQRGANLAQLTMAAQFYTQEGLTRPNVTQRGANLAQIYVTLSDRKKNIISRRRAKRAARL